MFFLIRAAFYIGVVLLVMPPPKEAAQPSATLASTEGAAGTAAGAKKTSVDRTIVDRPSADATKAKVVNGKAANGKAANGKAATAKGGGIQAGTSRVASVPSSDVAGYGAKAAAYCLRKPDVCRSGAGAADGIGERLSRGLRVISVLVADAAASPATTGSVSRGAP
jgi:hypothetical protein